MGARRGIVAVLASGVCMPLVAGFAASVPAQSAVSSVAHNIAGSDVPNVAIRKSTSQNWSGYAAYNSTFSSVSATWTQPSVSCTSKSTYSSFWVGLDGYNSNSVEQTGTEADCSSGSATYYSWYEVYPHPSYYAAVTVSAGHKYSASVTYGGSNRFTLQLTDITTGQSFQTTQRVNAKRASAEVVVEAPYQGGILPLANYGSVAFTGAYANSKALGTFNPLDPITMNDPNGGTSTPGSFDSTGTQFSATYS